ncbi:rab-GTPase-TBC domain-containing protein [Ditylenchus destructor]|nr:rab-GTPase-TBC domain-containing protein [Ditylenchus destructor]
MSARYHERVEHIEQLLLIQNQLIDTTSLRCACLYGIPDQLRPLCWRLFLHFLPKERHLWASTLRQQRNHYDALVQSLLAVSKTNYASVDMEQSTVVDDHPLAGACDSIDSRIVHSEWINFFKDNEVLMQIDKDVKRLRPEIDFFQRRTAYPKGQSSYTNLAKRIQSEKLSADVHEINFSNKSFIENSTANGEQEIEKGEAISEGEELHWQVVERILFIYAKLNPGVKYVQGMNEIVGPIYHVFAADSDPEWAEWAEADTFYCFQNLMSEIKDNFIRTLDNSNCGIESVLSRFYERFQRLDAPLYKHLAEDLGIRPQFYAFRWISLLLSQEFSLPDVIALWDTVFCSTNRLESVQFLCLAMLEHIRDELLSGDFSHNVRLLQNYPEVDVSKLVIYSAELMEANNTNPISSSQQSLSTIAQNGNSDTNYTLDRITVPAKNWSLKAKSGLTHLVRKTREQVNKYTSN